MYELYLISNGTILLYTMVLPPIELVGHVRDTCTIRYTRHITFVTKSFILDIARVLDPPLHEPYGLGLYL